MQINNGWSKWFAWYPVLARRWNNKYRWIWFKMIEREVKGFSNPIDGWISVDYRYLHRKIGNR